MSYIIVGLGNPGAEYKETRHNTGRIILEHLNQAFRGDEFVFDKKLNALSAEIKIGKDKVKLVSPETFMNNSGKTVSQLVKSPKAAQQMVVIYDDFNLPLGRLKISYNRSSGGHNGLESVIRAVKTEAFVRIRIGTSPANTKGQAKVPHGESKIEKFILGKFSAEEIKILKKVCKQVAGAIELLIKEGREKAMSVYNAG